MRVIFDSEAELEGFIYEKYKETNECCIDGRPHDHMQRQLSLGSYGICDLVGFSYFQINEKRSHVDVTVYELKKEKITSDAFAQVSRYSTAIREAFELEGDSIDVSITCVLVGTEIDDSCFILNETEFEYYKPFFNPDSGVDFEEISNGWKRQKNKIQFITELVSMQIREEVK